MAAIDSQVWESIELNKLCTELWLWILVLPLPVSKIGFGAWSLPVTFLISAQVPQRSVIGHSRSLVLLRGLGYAHTFGNQAPFERICSICVH